MPKVTFSFSEQFTDARSNELAYRFEIENQGPTSIDVLSIASQVPEGATLIESRDASRVAVKAKHDEICLQLTQLLRHHLMVASSDFRAKRVELEGQVTRDLIQTFSGFFKLYVKMIWALVRKSARDALRRQLRTGDALFVKIESLSDAQVAYEVLLKPLGASDVAVGDTFSVKMRQLEQLSSSPELNALALATIESQTKYSRTFVFKFPRSMLNLRKFTISTDVVYVESGNRQQQYNGGTATSVVISPTPLVLSVIAVIGGALGVLLKFAPSAAGMSTPEFYQKASQALAGQEGVTAYILAFIFFNVYEHTEFGSRFVMGISWRTALLIGALCGLLHARILEALTALLT